MLSELSFVWFLAGTLELDKEHQSGEKQEDPVRCIPPVRGLKLPLFDAFALGVLADFSFDVFL